MTSSEGKPGGASGAPFGETDPSMTAYVPVEVEPVAVKTVVPS